MKDHANQLRNLLIGICRNIKMLESLAQQRFDSPIKESGPNPCTLIYCTKSLRKTLRFYKHDLFDLFGTKDPLEVADHSFN